MPIDSEVFWSWAWSPGYVRRATRGESRIILPDSMGMEPALVHFSKFDGSGQEYNWLWLFERTEEAFRLRLLPTVIPERAQCDTCGLIESTLPVGSRDNYVQIVPRNWLQDLPLEELGIQEIRLGFNYKNYLSHGMAAACRRYSVEEFRELATR